MSLSRNTEEIKSKLGNGIIWLRTVQTVPSIIVIKTLLLNILVRRPLLPVPGSDGTDEPSEETSSLTHEASVAASCEEGRA